MLYVWVVLCGDGPDTSCMLFWYIVSVPCVGIVRDYCIIAFCPCVICMSEACELSVSVSCGCAWFT